MSEPLQREELETEPEEEDVDMVLLALEQALHRREALILVTGQEADARGELIRSALERYEDAYVSVLVSAAEDEPIVALDRLAERAGDDTSEASAEQKRSALARIMDEAGALGRPILVVVDDAELAATEQLERLRTALQLTQSPLRATQLVLAGSPKLIRKLKKRDARGLWTRVTTHVRVPASSESTRDSRIEPETAATEAYAANRRSPVMAVASAAVLAAALVFIVTIARRSEVADVQRVAQVTVQAARPIDAAVPSVAVPAGAPADLSGVLPAQSVAAVAVTGALPTGAAPESPQAQASDALAKPSTGPKVTEYLGVETVRGTPPHGREAAGVEANVPAPASPAQPDEPARAAKLAKSAGAQVVSVESSTVTARLPTAGAPSQASQPAAGKLSQASPSAPAAAPAVASLTPSAASPSSSAELSPAAPLPATAADSTTESTPVPASSAPPPVAAVEAAGTAESGSPASPESKPAIATPKPAADAQAAAVASKPGEQTAAKISVARSAAGITVQVGAFANAANAAALKKSLAPEFPSVAIDETSVAGRPFFRVRVGPFSNTADAIRTEQRLKALGHQPVRYGRPNSAG